MFWRLQTLNSNQTAEEENLSTNFCWQRVLMPPAEPVEYKLDNWSSIGLYKFWNKEDFIINMEILPSILSLDNTVYQKYVHESM